MPEQDQIIQLDPYNQLMQMMLPILMGYASTPGGPIYPGAMAAGRSPMQDLATQMAMQQAYGGPPSGFGFVEQLLGGSMGGGGRGIPPMYGSPQPPMMGGPTGYNPFAGPGAQGSPYFPGYPGGGQGGYGGGAGPGTRGPGGGGGGQPNLPFGGAGGIPPWLMGILGGGGGGGMPGGGGRGGSLIPWMPHENLGGGGGFGGGQLPPWLFGGGGMPGGGKGGGQPPPWMTGDYPPGGYHSYMGGGGFGPGGGGPPSFIGSQPNRNLGQTPAEQWPGSGGDSYGMTMVGLPGKSAEEQNAYNFMLANPGAPNPFIPGFEGF